MLGRLAFVRSGVLICLLKIHRRHSNAKRLDARLGFATKIRRRKGMPGSCGKLHTSTISSSSHKQPECSQSSALSYHVSQEISQARLGLSQTLSDDLVEGKTFTTNVAEKR
jgi:hypothetical protein